MVMLWNLVVLVGFGVEREGGQKAGHPTYNPLPSDKVRNLASLLIPRSGFTCLMASFCR